MASELDEHSTDMPATVWMSVLSQDNKVRINTNTPETISTKHSVLRKKIFEYMSKVNFL